MLQKSNHTDFGLDDAVTDWGPIIADAEAIEDSEEVREAFRVTAERMYSQFTL
jgi:hypothetical protein